VHDPVHEVRAIAAMQPAAGYPVVGCAKSLHEANDAKPNFRRLGRGRLEKGTARITLLTLPQLLDDRVECLLQDMRTNFGSTPSPFADWSLQG